MQAELSNEEAVDQADEGAHSHDGQQGHEDPEAVDGGEVCKHLVDEVGLLQEHAGDGGGQAGDTACGQVGTGQDDTACNAQSHGQVGGHLGDQVGEGAQGQEVGLFDGGVNDKNRHQDVQRIIQDAVDPEPLLVLDVHLAVFGSSALEIGNRISHG